MTGLVPETVLAALSVRGMSLQQHLGSGVFGDAYLVRTHEGCLRVVKRSKAYCEAAYTVSEATNMCTLNSEHVVHMYQAWCDKHDGHLYLELEYCNGGNLEQFLDTHFPLPAPRLVSFAVQLVVGLDHIHMRHMIHRDFKLENIFLHCGDGADPVVKIGDFGLSKVVTSTEGNAETRLGTPLYFAPELLNGHSYTRRADLWALGVSLFQLMMNRTPFDGPTLQEVAKNILTLTPRLQPSATQRPTQLCDITLALLSRNRKLRPSTRNVLQATDFTRVLGAPPWLPVTLHNTVPLFVCRQAQDVSVHVAPSNDARALVTLHYGDQVRVQRCVQRGTSNELWVRLVHPMEGYCRTESDGFRRFQSLQDPRYYGAELVSPTPAARTTGSSSVKSIARDLNVHEPSS